jgi:hypothetical protein
MPKGRVRQGLIRARPDWQHEFAFLLVDGLSIREDQLTGALASGLGPVPLFGGLAGDRTRFRENFVLYRGRALRNAAVMALLRSDCRVNVFSLDHPVPTDRRMVVTGADPRSRTVRQINAEPGAREHARLLGKDPAQLTTFTFAAYPVVVRNGGKHHVRAIQQVADTGDLVVFSAIDEGLVMTLAEPRNIVARLEGGLGTLAKGGAPDAIIAGDCIVPSRMIRSTPVRRTCVDMMTGHRDVWGHDSVPDGAPQDRPLPATIFRTTLSDVATLPARSKRTRCSFPITAISRQTRQPSGPPS